MKLYIPLPHSVGLVSIKEWLRNLPIRTKQTLITGSQFSSDEKPYGREIIYQDTRLEILLTGWHPGNVCLPHDHGASTGTVLVLCGNLTNTIHDPRTLSPLRIWEVNEGEVFTIHKGAIHSVTSGSQKKLVGLHAYCPAVNSMTVFDPKAGKKWQVRSTAGAWRPEADDIINETNLEKT